MLLCRRQSRIEQTKIKITTEVKKKKKEKRYVKNKNSIAQFGIILLNSGFDVLSSRCFLFNYYLFVSIIVVYEILQYIIIICNSTVVVVRCGRYN